jgi:hypothetical protein
VSQPPPPEPPPPTQGLDRPYYGTALPLPPINGELIVFVFMLLVAALVALATDEVNAVHFLVAAVALAIGYMLSRGIAKAGKALEGRWG